MTHDVATSRTAPRTLPRFLMCRPQHFAVAYSINPWMDPKSWAHDDAALTIESRKEWTRLHRTLLHLGAQVEFGRASCRERV